MRVFRAAVDACRAQTVRHLALPPGEQFTIEYVTGKSWSGYNWYQGNYRSLIQVNTDLPIFIDRALDLACHEGYPGHHVYNVLLEQHLVRDRGWQEFTVYPLFSPQSLIAEGTANFGIDVAYPGEPSASRSSASTLFPLAGLDPAPPPKYYDVLAELDRLSLRRQRSRAPLSERRDHRGAGRRLAGDVHALRRAPRAEQRVRFFDQYRSYVINYNLGKDLVRAYVERLGGVGRPPTSGGVSSASCCRRRGCRRGCDGAHHNHDATTARRSSIAMTRTATALTLSIVLGFAPLAAQKKPAPPPREARRRRQAHQHARDPTPAQ